MNNITQKRNYSFNGRQYSLVITGNRIYAKMIPTMLISLLMAKGYMVILKGGN